MGDRVAAEWSQRTKCNRQCKQASGLADTQDLLISVQFAGPEEKEANEGKKEQKRGPSLISGSGHCTLRDPGPGELMGAHYYYGSIIRGP